MSSKVSRGTRNLSHTVGRGPVPSRARVAKRSRGTGPRATEPGALFTTIATDRPRATEPGPRNLSHTVGRGPVPRHARVAERARGTGPRATKPRALFTTSARDRHSRDGTGDKKPLTHRRAGACPPPCSGRRTIARDRHSRYGNAGVIFNDREGQALALRCEAR